MNKRGIRSRYITSITKDNFSYCKEAMKIGELRHLDGIKGNFAVSEKEYMASATLEEASLLQQVIYSNVKEVLEQQQYVFDSFWSRSVPAEQKIMEIEEGIIAGRTEIIHNPKEIQELFIKMVKSAKHEVLLVLPTINAFYREERIGIIDLLKHAAEGDQRINVRILAPTNDVIERKLQNMVSATGPGNKERENKEKRFDIRSIDIKLTNQDEDEVEGLAAAAAAEKSSVTTVTIVVVDRKESLVIEKIDDSKQNFTEAVGMATYSNSKPTVLSYISIFENLWKQSELYQQVKKVNEQLKIHDKMQKEFINVAAHELRTPIQPILGLTQVIYSKIDEDRSPHVKQKQKEMLEVVIRNANRLQRLTEDILDVTRIESQNLNLKLERLNLGEIISNGINDAKRSHQLKKMLVCYIGMIKIMMLSLYKQIRED
jgi:hypothetical protein